MLFHVEMERITVDTKSWQMCAAVSVVAVGITVAFILLFLPYIIGQVKTTIPSKPPPTPLPNDPNYYQDQGGGIFTDIKGNIYTGNIQKVNTLDGSWGPILWGSDKDAKGVCCDIFHSEGWALWFLYKGGGSGLSICSNECNHQRARSCLLGRNYFAYRLATLFVTFPYPYTPSVDYTSYTNTLAGLQRYRNTDVWLIPPPIHACDRWIHTIVNETILV